MIITIYLGKSSLGFLRTSWATTAQDLPKMLSSSNKFALPLAKQEDMHIYFYNVPRRGV